MKYRLFRITLPLLAFAYGCVAQAAILTSAEQTFDLPLNFSAAPIGSQSRSTLAMFNGFDPALGVLSRVTLTLDSAYSASMNVGGENQSPESALEVRGDYAGELRVQFIDPTLHALIGLSETISMDAACSAGFPGSCLAQAWDARAPVISMDIDPYYFPAFAFPISVELSNFGFLGVNAFSNFGGLGSGSADSNWAGALRLAYEYSPTVVPEPSAMAMLMLGLATLSGMRCRSCRVSKPVPETTQVPPCRRANHD